MCGTLPVDTSFSSRLLKLSAAWKLVTGPVNTAESNTAPASSMSLEKVYAAVNVSPRENRFSSFDWNE